MMIKKRPILRARLRARIRGQKSPTILAKRFSRMMQKREGRKISIVFTCTHGLWFSRLWVLPRFRDFLRRRGINDFFKVASDSSHFERHKGNIGKFEYVIPTTDEKEIRQRLAEYNSSRGKNVRIVNPNFTNLGNVDVEFERIVIEIFKQELLRKV